MEKKTTSVEKALQVLSCFTVQDIDLSLNELHERLKIPKPTLRKLCDTLCENGFLSRHSATDRYRLGIKMLETAEIYITGNNAYHSVWRILSDIMEISGETVVLYKNAGDQRICIMKIESNSPIRHTVTIGQTLPLEKGAAGKVISAQTDKSLSAIKEEGVAVTFGEREAYMGAMAVPVFDSEGELYGALSISGPVERIREKVSDDLKEELKKHAEAMSNLVLSL